MDNEIRDEVDRAVKAQVRTCDERAKRFEKSVEDIGDLKDLFINFTAETQEHRRSVEQNTKEYRQQVRVAMDEHHTSLYGNDPDHPGIQGKVMILEQNVGRHNKLVNRGTAIIWTVIVTSGSSLVASIVQFFKGVPPSVQ